MLVQHEKRSYVRSSVRSSECIERCVGSCINADVVEIYNFSIFTSSLSDHLMVDDSGTHS